METIPYGKQDISEEDIQAVAEVLRSDFITQGPKVPEFERALADYTGAKFGVAVNSATSALHIACLALGVGPGDVVWTSPITFVASANCALYCGASVDFVDIDPDTYNMSPDRLREKLIEARANNKLPKVVIPVHLAGQSCQMKEIFELSEEFGFSLIEDASHAIGGKYKDKPVGSCEYSNITVFSFHPVKIMTTAEGGMAMTNDEEMAAKMSRLRTHGITRDVELMSRNDGPWYYEQIELGFNYRMTELQAALGLSQLRRLDEFVNARHKVAQFYNESLSELPLKLPIQHHDSYSSFHLFPIRLDLELLKRSHAEVFESLRERKIGVNLHYIPVHLQPYYRKMMFKVGDFPESEKYYRESISLPMFSNLSRQQHDYVSGALKEVVL